MPARFQRISENVVPGNIGVAGCGRHEARQDPHSSAFTRSIGSQKSHNLAFFDLERKIVDGNHAGIFFGELFDFDHWIRPAKSMATSPRVLHLETGKARV